MYWHISRPRRDLESSLLTTYWSESNLSLRWFGGPASRLGSLNSLFQIALHLPSTLRDVIWPPSDILLPRQSAGEYTPVLIGKLAPSISFPKTEYDWADVMLPHRHSRGDPGSLIYIYIFITINLFLHICILYIFIFLYICIHISIYPSIYPSIYLSIYLFLYIYVCVYIYK